MEPSETIISEEWSSISGFYTAQEDEFMTQFYENCSVPEDLYGNPNLLGFPSSSSSSAFWPTHFTGDDSFYFPSNVSHDPTNNNFGSISMCCEVQVSEPAQDDDHKTSNLERKRSMSSVEIQKNKRNVEPRRNNNPTCSKSNKEEERSNNDYDSLYSSRFCSSSEDDPIVASSHQEDDTNPKNNIDLKSNLKSRSNTGPSTEAQSLYARRRRLRINERLRILQNLVPSGTKVDISTMLEEAVQYVKFLQLQIKLLSSDDLWMYAPIAFNGLNIGLDLNITPTRQP
ncbi:hypothetical protein QN277_005236 [Acacia crassicarpa]|uniref:BHLH domain-containing protein n=1 Tax=Acacia crassicarpa TaxID=499986 RepID=A0AAE1MBA2_9FABA|nr:hypothetical protein QN277_005236 [Acacia crassicarpa]